MVHNISTFRQISPRIIVSVAVIKKLRIFPLAVDQAYLQRKEKLSRETYLAPKKKDRKFSSLDDDEVRQLVEPMYGITDAEDYWGVTVYEHHNQDLLLAPLAGDPALYCKPNDEDIDGITVFYVDDKSIAGNEIMQDLAERTLQIFESELMQWDDLDFFSTHLKIAKTGYFHY